MALLTWHFPLPRTHTGVLAGNARMGLMIWGDQALHLTVARAGFWDHRGANDFSARANYEQVADLLQRGDGETLQRLFTASQADPSQPPCPTQLGLARIELHFIEDLRPRQAVLDTCTGSICVTLANAQGRSLELTIGQSMDQELAWIQGPCQWREMVSGLRVRPSWEWIGAERSPYGMQAPRLWQDNGTHPSGGMEQALPEDDAAALAYAWREDALAVATSLGPAPYTQALARVQESDLAAAEQARAQWWQAYQAKSARLQVPDAVIQEIWDYGMYKQACLTTPNGLAATLQGPWLEEYQVPPWSCDYHFNINIEMIYWPCLATGHGEHLQPLWQLIREWMPQLRHVAQQFFASDEALMLPHAVDDRCRTVGAFWTGCIDSACTAWMAQLAWQHYQHSGDQDFLAETAWPLLRGAFATYWAMLEEDGDGGWCLPVSVSPEFKGARDDAWGRNASFQLAAVHFLLRTLPQAAAVLGQSEDPRWHMLRHGLPRYSVGDHPITLEYPERTRPRLELWEGMDLVESHRHHSHLGGIYPFCIIDPRSAEDAQVVANSIHNWIRKGPGAWSGWAVPWAASILARCGHAQGAVAWLHFWRQHFTNEGRGTLHDAAFYGASTLYQLGSGSAGEGGASDEIMQIEAGQGALNAVCELLLQDCGEVIRLAPAIPDSWQGWSVCGLHAAGGLVIDMHGAGGRLQQVDIQVQRSGLVCVECDLGPRWTCNGAAQEGRRLRRTCQAGEVLILQAL
ncbi:MAG: hypothetical protein EA401_12640 [Planctomycetota bacterium]|nr:MAG: hypothetical protein EA401_12640 [Planctomycetota bacterium]